MTANDGSRAKALRRQTAGLLLLAAGALIYLLLRYGSSVPWSWR